MPLCVSQACAIWRTCGSGLELIADCIGARISASTLWCITKCSTAKPTNVRMSNPANPSMAVRKPIFAPTAGATEICGKCLWQRKTASAPHSGTHNNANPPSQGLKVSKIIIPAASSARERTKLVSIPMLVSPGTIGGGALPMPPGVEVAICSGACTKLSSSSMSLSTEMFSGTSTWAETLIWGAEQRGQNGVGERISAEHCWQIRDTLQSYRSGVENVQSGGSLRNFSHCYAIIAYINVLK